MQKAWLLLLCTWEVSTIEISDYLAWIIDIFDGNDYTCLFSQLMTIPFRYSVQLDANLIPCVRKFRSKMGRDYDGPRGGPTVLEIFCALAVECEDKLMHNDDYGNRTCVWFWMILKNLELDDYSDDVYSSRAAEDVEDTINIFLDRGYDQWGDGGPFVVKKPYYDMRRAPLWEQLNWELNEEYADEFRMEL